MAAAQNGSSIFPLIMPTQPINAEFLQDAYVQLIELIAAQCAPAAGTVGANFTIASPTGQIGFTTGSGGTVTQATSRTTGVTLNTPTGQITTNNASLAAETAAEFTVTNSAVAIGDIPILAQQSGSNSGNTDMLVSGVAAGSFKIKVVNNNASGGTAETGAIIFNYAIIKGAAA